MICIEVMEVRVRHGKFRITGFEVGYDLRDLVLTPDQIRLRLFGKEKIIITWWVYGLVDMALTPGQVERVVQCRF